jgi:hypothetical protein
LGTEREVLIKKEAEVIEDHCFCSCESLRKITFETGSALRRIGSRAFEETGLKQFHPPSKWLGNFASVHVDGFVKP